MEENTNTCMCGERPEVELNTDERPLVVLSDEECDCGCDEVELYTDHQPDIILFEEWADEHVDDIIAAREAAEAARDLVEEKAAVIIEKENTILDNTDNIRDLLNNGITWIRGDIRTGFDNIKTNINTKYDSLVSFIASCVRNIREDIANILINQELTECSEDEVYDMFRD